MREDDWTENFGLNMFSTIGDLLLHFLVDYFVLLLHTLLSPRRYAKRCSRHRAVVVVGDRSSFSAQRGVEQPSLGANDHTTFTGEFCVVSSVVCGSYINVRKFAVVSPR